MQMPLIARSSRKWVGLRAGGAVRRLLRADQGRTHVVGSLIRARGPRGERGTACRRAGCADRGRTHVVGSLFRVHLAMIDAMFLDRRAVRGRRPRVQAPPPAAVHCRRPPPAARRRPPAGAPSAAGCRLQWRRPLPAARCPPPAARPPARGWGGWLRRRRSGDVHRSRADARGSTIEPRASALDRWDLCEGRVSGGYRLGSCRCRYPSPGSRTRWTGRRRRCRCRRRW
jgi:hypothetical protein